MVKGSSVGDVELVLAHPSRLFGGEGADPYLPDYDCVAGIDRLIAAVSTRSDLGRRAERVVLRLNSGVAEADADSIATAIARYCLTHADDFDRKARAKGLEGVQTAYLSVVVIMVALALSLLVRTLAGLPPLVQDLLVDGLVIAGWVALWRPIDLLLYEPWLLRREARILRTIAGLKVTVTAT